jgi:hypothetical protein
VLLATESDIEWARALLDESNDIAARQAYPMLLAISQYQRARCAMVQGDLESAMVAIDSALQGFTNLHARGKTFSCYALFVRAQLAFIQGRMASARAHLASALEFLLVLGDSTWIARVIELCAESVLGDGDFFAAAEFLGSSFSVAPVFLTYPLDDNRRRERLTASLRSYLGSIDFATAIGIGSRRSIHDVRRLMPREFSARADRIDRGRPKVKAARSDLDSDVGCRIPVAWHADRLRKAWCFASRNIDLLRVTKRRTATDRDL